MDRYDLQARHLPVAVTLLPLIILAVATIPDLRGSLWLPAAGLAGVSGMYWLLARHARVRGRELEVRLYSAWGGMPSTALLRHRDPRLNKHTKAVYHDRLRKLGAPFIIPTQDEEARDTSAADDRYAAAMDELRRRAKATKNPIVLRENINYGGARNLLALKPLGIAIVVVSLAVLVAVIGAKNHWILDLVKAIEVACGVALILDLIAWVVLVNPSLVKHQADAYAYALIESAEDGSRRSSGRRSSSEGKKGAERSEG